MELNMDLNIIEEKISLLELSFNFQCIFIGLNTKGEKFVFASSVGKDYYEKHISLLEIFYDFCYEKHKLVNEEKNNVEEISNNLFAQEPSLKLEASSHADSEQSGNNINSKCMESYLHCENKDTNYSPEQTADQTGYIISNYLDDFTENFKENKVIKHKQLNRLKKRLKERKKSKLKNRNKLTNKNNPNTVHLCKWCDQTFCILEEKHQHISQHLRDGFNCNKCDASFKTWITLKNHMASVHAQEYLFQCRDCKMMFKSSLLLHRHALKLHTNDGIGFVGDNRLDDKPDINFILCSFCGRNFESEKELQRHVGYMHRRHRLVVCNYCNKGFKNRLTLDKHIGNVHINNNQKVKLEINLNDFNENVDNNNAHHRSLNDTSFNDAFTPHEQLLSNDGPKFDFLSSDITCKNELSSVLMGDSELNLLDDLTHKDIVTSLLNEDEPIEDFISNRKIEDKVKSVCKKKSVNQAGRNLCHVCGKNFSQPHYLQQHLVCHHERRPYRCTHCGKQFKRLSTLHEHEAVHGDSKRFKCQICGREFKFASVLRQHKLVHTRDRPHQCDVCKKSFKKLTELHKHLCAGVVSNSRLTIDRGLLHKDENVPAIEVTPDQQPQRIISELEISKPYACHLCPKRFNLQKSLKKHSRVHSDLRPYVCETCSKSFKHPSSLRQHRSVHSDDRPFKCTCCDKRFKSATSLNEHMDKNKYKCTGCGREYMHKKSLRVHMNTCSRLPPPIVGQQGSGNLPRSNNHLSQKHHLKRQQQHHRDQQHGQFLNDKQISGEQPDSVLLQIMDQKKSNNCLDQGLFSTLVICQQQLQNQQQQHIPQLSSDQQYTTITIPAALFIQNAKQLPSILPQPPSLLPALPPPQLSLPLLQDNNQMPLDISFTMSTNTNSSTNDSTLQLNDAQHWLLNTPLNQLQLQDQQLQQLLQQQFL